MEESITHAAKLDSIGPQVSRNRAIPFAHYCIHNLFRFVWKILVIVCTTITQCNLDEAGTEHQPGTKCPRLSKFRTTAQYLYALNG